MNEVAPELIARCQKGDTTAFDELVTATQNSIFNMSFRILGNREDAQDIAQEVYLRVWRGLPAFRAESKFSTWLYRVVVNACLNRKRQLRGQLQVVDNEAIWELLPEPAPEPLRRALQGEQNTRLWAAVDSLDSKYRLVITLFYQEEMTYQEIAFLLVLPIGTVKAHLNRARTALARILPDMIGVTDG
ncbi:MAG: RNA polymerase sigma factor [Anaerolineae bacterium]